MSYLLHLWQTESDGELIWRASLEGPHTGERMGFANVVDLLTFPGQESGHVTWGQPRVFYCHVKDGRWFRAMKSSNSTHCNRKGSIDKRTRRHRSVEMARTERPSRHGLDGAGNCADVRQGGES